MARRLLVCPLCLVKLGSIVEVVISCHLQETGHACGIYNHRRLILEVNLEETVVALDLVRFTCYLFVEQLTYFHILADALLGHTRLELLAGRRLRWTYLQF